MTEIINDISKMVSIFSVIFMASIIWALGQRFVIWVLGPMRGSLNQLEIAHKDEKE